MSPGAIADTAGTAKLGGMGGNKGRGGSIPPADDESVPRVMRMGTVDDIGNACVFLCSAAGGWISGDTIQVDGAGFLRRGVPRNEEGLSNVDRGDYVRLCIKAATGLRLTIARTGSPCCCIGVCAAQRHIRDTTRVCTHTHTHARARARARARAHTHTVY